MFVKTENQTSLTSGHLFRAGSSLIEDVMDDIKFYLVLQMLSSDA